MTFFPILAAATEHAGPIQTIAEQFGVDWWKLISQAISFSIVAFVLHRFAYKPILEVLDVRRHKIEEGLANAEKIKVQLAEAKQSSEEIITKASTESQRIIDEARSAAKSLQEREAQRAVGEAEQIISKARQATEIEYQRMLADLKREVARLVVGATAKVSGKILTPDDHTRLSEEATREIAA